MITKIKKLVNLIESIKKLILKTIDWKRFTFKNNLMTKNDRWWVCDHFLNFRTLSRSRWINSITKTSTYQTWSNQKVNLKILIISSCWTMKRMARAIHLLKSQKNMLFLI